MPDDGQGIRLGCEAYLTMPRTSSSRMIRNSSPSSLISVPEYLPKRIWSPALTSSGNTLPSSFDLPLPTEITSPCCGFSLALSGMMMPPRMLSPYSTRRTRMRSCSGVNVFAIALHLLSYDLPGGQTVRVYSTRTNPMLLSDSPQNCVETSPDAWTFVSPCGSCISGRL